MSSVSDNNGSINAGELVFGSPNAVNAAPSNEDASRHSHQPDDAPSDVATTVSGEATSIDSWDEEIDGGTIGTSSQESIATDQSKVAVDENRYGTQMSVAAIHSACASGDITAIKALVEEDPSVAHIRDADGTTPLHVAIMHGHLPVVKHLVRACHVDVNCKSNDGSTPHNTAIAHCELEIAQYLTRYCDDDIVMPARNHHADTTENSAKGENMVLAARSIRDKARLFKMAAQSRRPPARNIPVPTRMDIVPGKGGCRYGSGNTMYHEILNENFDFHESLTNERDRVLFRMDIIMAMKFDGFRYLNKESSLGGDRVCWHEMSLKDSYEKLRVAFKSMRRRRRRNVTYAS